MTHEPTPPQQRSPLIWISAAVLTLAGVGYGALNFDALTAQIAKLRSVETAALEQPGMAPLPAPSSDQSAPIVPTGPVLAFDIVRVETDGATLVAGRAEPGDIVSIIVDGVPMGQAEADASGSFVAFLDLAQSTEPRLMWLMAETEDGDVTLSDGNVILAPRANPADPRQIATTAILPPEGTQRGTLPGGGAAALVRAPAAGTPFTASAQLGTAAQLSPPPAQETGAQAIAQAIAQASIDAGTDAAYPPEQSQLGAKQTPQDNAPADIVIAALSPSPSVSAQVTLPTDGPGDTAPRVLVSDAEGVRAFDAPRLANPKDLRLDTISYGVGGDVLLRGRTGPGGEIRIRLSGVEAGRATADLQGLWLARLNGIAQGDYALQLDRLDADGSQISTLSLPFRRESPERLAEALGPNDIQIVTVQPGATLWAIARDRYGDGARYVQVFEANRAQITDPDLIFPGQVFGLPANAGTETGAGTGAGTGPTSGADE